ncbi:MAG: ELWxxDGT repeat protein [Vicinamibacteria bacterium]
MLARIAATVLLAACAVDAHAQSAYRISDIVPGPSGSNPTQFARAGSVAVFVTEGTEHGLAIWRSDGTRESTGLLLDMRPEPGQLSTYDSVYLAELGSHVLVLARHWSPSEAHFVKLWRSDGTVAGTELLKEWATSATLGSYPPVASGANVYFRMSTPENGSELWKSDGTVAGTTMVHDIAPGPMSSTPSGLVAFEGGVVFSAYTPNVGWELWKSDGTAAGTTLIKDIEPGPSHSYPTWPKAVWNGRVFFAATRSSTGNELWVSDGTQAGTRLVADLYPGSSSSSPYGFLAATDLVYFAASDQAHGGELYRTDGTAAGTHRLTELTQTESPGPLLAAGPLAYFSGNSPAGTTTPDFEPYVTDGTVQGTRLLKDLNPGPNGSDPYFLASVAGRMHFATSGPSSETLWRSDGTAEGTQPVPGGLTRPARTQGVVIDDRLFFAADDGRSGVELWTLQAGAPAADAGPDQRVAVDQVAHLDASGSSDPEGDPLMFEWRDADDVLLASTAAFDLSLPAGIHEITVAVSDGTHTTLDTVIVRVGALLRLTVHGPQWSMGSSVLVDVEPGQPCGELFYGQRMCEYAAAPGTTLTLTPIAGPALSFVGWTGACSGNGPCTLTMSDLQETEAHFTDELTLTVGVGGTGEGHVDLYSPFSPTGTVCTSSAPCSLANVPRSTTFRVWARPAPGSIFTGWDLEGCANWGALCEFTLVDHTTVTAQFSPAPRTLSINLSSQESGLGSVNADPPGTTCTLATPGSVQNCSESYVTAALVTLTATAAPGSIFTGWTGACSGTGGCTVTMSSNQNVGAAFASSRTLTTTLTGLQNGAGSVTASPSGTICALTPPAATTQCQGDHAHGTIVTLTASPAAGFYFTGWSGACTGTAPTCSISMSSAQQVTAAFGGSPVLTLQIDASPGGMGSVRVDPPDTLCTASTPTGIEACNYQHSYGELVTLTALPPEGWMFAGWSATGCSGVGPCTVTMSQNTTVAAAFRRLYSIWLSVTGEGNAHGRVDIEPAGGPCEVIPSAAAFCAWTFGEGTIVRLTPKPAFGTVFDGWSGGCAGTGNCEIALTENVGLGARFRHVNQPPTASLLSPSNGAVLPWTPEGVRVSATATDLDGAIASVVFSVNLHTISSDSTPPYEATWIPTGPGNHALQAIAVDDEGRLGFSSLVRVTVVNAPPTISVTSPLPGAVFSAPATVTLSADASDPDGTITRVEFFEGATSRGFDTTSPYSVTWSNVAAGSHALTAVATDNSGATTVVPFTVAVGTSVGATADTFVRDGTYATTNYGGASTLDVRKVTTVGHNRRAFFKFAVDAAPTVTSARLRLFGRLTGTQSFPVQALVFAVADTTWGESTMTWNNQPATTPTPLGGVVLDPNPSNEQWYEWDVTAHVRAAKAAGQAAVTLAVEEDVYAQGAAFRARSASAAMRPQLVLAP